MPVETTRIQRLPNSGTVLSVCGNTEGSFCDMPVRVLNFRLLYRRPRHWPPKRRRMHDSTVQTVSARQAVQFQSVQCLEKSDEEVLAFVEPIHDSSGPYMMNVFARKCRGNRSPRIAPLLISQVHIQKTVDQGTHSLGSGPDLIPPEKTGTNMSEIL